MTSLINLDTLEPVSDVRYFYTDGHVQGVLQVGEESPVFDTLLDRYGASSALVITAYSRMFPTRTIRQTAHAQLHGYLLAAQMKFLPAVGIDLTNEWDSEQGFLVFDVTGEQMADIVSRFEQCAVVRVEKGQPARVMDVRK